MSAGWHQALATTRRATSNAISKRRDMASIHRTDADRRLPPRYTLPVTGLILSGIMTVIISGISTLLALGLTGEFIGRWPIAWLTSWTIGFPTVLVVLPIVRRLVARIVAPPA